MYPEMTDEQAVFGPYRAKECEWTDPEPCLDNVVPTKAYCEKHMKLAYRIVSAKKAAKETEIEVYAELGEELVTDAE